MGRLDRHLLYSLATSDRFDALVHGSPLLSRAAFRRARRVVGGVSRQDALATVHRLASDGFAVSIDVFGEGVAEVDGAAEVVDEYAALAAALVDVEVDADLEVVPSHLGIDASVEEFCGHARRIVELLPADARLAVSAEESWRTPAIVEAVCRLAAEGAPITATLQANLHRSTADADRLAEAGVPVRVVKGAYLESSTVAHPWGEETDAALLRLAHRVHAHGTGLRLATHDPVVREALLLALGGVEVEMLLGVRTEDALELRQRGHPVRIYVPYGRQWLRYWLRRVAESRGA